MNPILQRPPPPTCSIYQMSDYTRLEVLTELVDSNLPEVQRQRMLSLAPAPGNVTTNKLNQHVDQTLSLGATMHMGPGHAFGLDQPEDRVPVGKRLYPNMGGSGRAILVEGVEVAKVWHRLQLLPDTALVTPKPGESGLVASKPGGDGSTSPAGMCSPTAITR
jgi:hypothetical protein